MRERPSNDPEPTPNRADAPATDRKRTYRKPVLTEYGTVAKLTRSNGSTQFEPSSDSIMQKMCL